MLDRFGVVQSSSVWTLAGGGWPMCLGRLASFRSGGLLRGSCRTEVLGLWNYDLLAYRIVSIRRFRHRLFDIRRGQYGLLSNFQDPWLFDELNLRWRCLVDLGLSRLDAGCFGDERSVRC